LEESRGREEDRRPTEEEYHVTGMGLGTYNDVVVDDNFRMLCVTAKTNTVTTAIVRIFVLRFSAMNFLYTCHQGGRCCLAAPDICCLSVEALQNYTIRLMNSKQTKY
jgi:hypothetical protein